MSTARVTDEQILELRGRLLRESGNQMTADTDACGAALRDPSGYPAHLRAVATFVRDAGRARCAELIEGPVKEEASAHVHSWTPIPLATARYECSCGEIVAQAADRRRTETSRRPHSDISYAPPWPWTEWDDGCWVCCSCGAAAGYQLHSESCRSWTRKETP